MSFYAASVMATNNALRDRIASCVAGEGEADPFGWLGRNIYRIVSDSDWVTKWDYAEDTKTHNVNPDTGARDDVISDAMILSRVQAIRAATP